MSTPLVLRSAPHPQEALHGYLLRLATLNCTGGVEPLFRRAGLRQRYDLPRPDLTALAKMTGQPTAALNRLGYWRLDLRRHQFGRHYIALSGLSRQQARVCPTCLEKSGFASRLWDVRMYVSCHKHGIDLVHQCPGCGRALTWWRPALTRCSCGYDLLGAPTSEADTGAVAIAADFARLDWDRQAKLAPTHDFSGYARLIGVLGAPPHERLALRRLQRLPAADAPAWVARAATYLDAWPRGFGRWLSQRQSERKRSAGMHEDFGGLIGQLRSTLPLPECGFILDALGEYLATSWKGAVSGRSVFHGVGSPAFVSSTEAGRQLGIRGQTVARMVECGRLAGEIRRQGGRRKILVKAKALEIGREGVFALQHSDVQAILGVSRLQARHLREAGLLRTANVPLRCQVEVGEPERLMREIAARCAQDSPPTDLVMLSKAPLLRIPLVQTLSRILNGELAVYRIGPGATLHAFAASHRGICGQTSTRGGGRRLSLKQAARELNTTPRQIRYMQLHGFLSRSDDIRFVVTDATISEFRAHIGAREIARKIGTKFRTAHNRLQRFGIQPVVASESRWGISAMWRRDDVESQLPRLRRGY